MVNQDFTLRMVFSKWKPNIEILWQKSSYLLSTLSYVENVKALSYNCC